MNKILTVIIGGVLATGAIGSAIGRNRVINSKNKELDRLHELAQKELEINGSISKETNEAIKRLEKRIKK